MNGSIPTPFELACIAATLRGSSADKPPLNAATEALELWDAAAAVIEQRESALSPRKTQATPSGGRATATRLAYGFDDNSPAMNWIQKNAEHLRDQFKIFKSFDAAWVETFPEPEHFGRGFSQTISDLERFLELRMEKRRNGDKERKRVKRGRK